jgi:hypothetical protein
MEDVRLPLAEELPEAKPLTERGGAGETGHGEDVDRNTGLLVSLHQIRVSAEASHLDGMAPINEPLRRPDGVQLRAADP